MLPVFQPFPFSARREEEEGGVGQMLVHLSKGEDSGRSRTGEEEKPLKRKRGENK